jgi:hypothetical protein
VTEGLFVQVSGFASQKIKDGECSLRAYTMDKVNRDMKGGLDFYHLSLCDCESGQ